MPYFLAIAEQWVINISYFYPYVTARYGDAFRELTKVHTSLYVPGCRRVNCIYRISVATTSIVRIWKTGIVVPLIPHCGYGIRNMEAVSLPCRLNDLAFLLVKIRLVWMAHSPWR